MRNTCSDCRPRTKHFASLIFFPTCRWLTVLRIFPPFIDCSTKSTDMKDLLLAIVIVVSRLIVQFKGARTSHRKPKEIRHCRNDSRSSLSIGLLSSRRRNGDWPSRGRPCFHCGPVRSGYVKVALVVCGLAAVRHAHKPIAGTSMYGKVVHFWMSWCLRHKVRCSLLLELLGVAIVIVHAILHAH